MRNRPVLAIAITLLLAVTGCGSRQGEKKDDAGNSKSQKTIGLSVLTLTNPFFKVIADNATEEAAKHGYRVAVVSGEFDVARQQNQVKDFIVQKVAAIVLCPCDSKSIGPAIQEAEAAGIPVFTADIACLAPGVRVQSHIATDNFSGGKQAAQAMILTRSALPAFSKAARAPKADGSLIAKMPARSGWA